MKETILVSLVQFAPAWLDPKLNAERMADFLDREAREHGAELIVFPELSSTGYLRPEPDIEFRRELHEASERVPGPTTELLGEVCQEHGVHAVVGISERNPRVPHVLHNSAALIGPRGEVLGVHRKPHLPFDERSFYAPGGSVEVHPTALANLGINICYDVRFPELARLQRMRGAEVMVSLWAYFEQAGKAPNDSVKIRCRARAAENAVYFLGCNRSGREGDRVYFGRSIVSGPSGEVVAESEGDAEEVVRGRLESSVLAAARAASPLLRERRPELYTLVGEPV